MDRWALHHLQKLIARVREAYERFEFHVVYHSVQNFCAVEMSALYFDILKDRLYTFPSGSQGRKSAQTALYEILKRWPVSWLLYFLSHRKRSGDTFLKGLRRDRKVSS